MPSFSIIIPAYNSAQTLSKLLTSFDDQDYRDFEVIVVDDGSTDHTEAVVRTHRDVQYVRMPVNSGPSAARNRGAESASADWLVFADSDTVFEPDTMASIHDALAIHEVDALVGNYAGAPANDGFVPWYKGLWEYSMLEEALAERGDLLTPLNTWAPRPGVIRRDAFEAIGGFSTSFHGADLEDMELGYRLAQNGFRTYLCPAVQIRHHYPKNVWAELRPFARRSALWMRMATQRRALDSHGEGTGRQALAHLLGFGGFIALLIAIVYAPFWWLAIPALAAFATLNGRFITLAWRERGLRFATAALAYSWVHSIVLGLAAGYGLLTWWQGPTVTA